MGSYKMCLLFTRKFRQTEAQPPPDIKQAFERFTHGESHMTAEQLLQFLIHFQGEQEATIYDAEKIMHDIVQQRHHITKFARHSLTFDDFHHYLFSDNLNPPINNEVHHDMTAPLSHYYIYTGHNSYLTGNQLTSDCSDAPVIKALMSGVRVIELDVWPNTSGDNVIVYHGRTLTPPVELITCLKSIKKHAFLVSSYPVVITLEDHLTPSLRAKVAKMAAEAFGDILYHPEPECLKEFPSPEELKHRIIISTKPPKEYLETKIPKDKRKVSFDKEAGGTEFKTIKDVLKGDQIFDEDGSDLDECNIEEDVDFVVCGSHSRQLVDPEYKRLIGIHAKKHNGKLKESLKVDINKVGRLSLNEQALEKATISHGRDLVRFTQRNFLRVYPKGSRVFSSNYNPLIAWRHGAQMVAFNMQGYDRPLWLMHGMFRSNGGCGYVRKPEFLIKEDPPGRVFSPKIKLPVKKILKVRVYMGDGWRLDFSPTHFDSYSPPDFYVKVRIAGAPADKKRKKTKILVDNWTPVWDQEFHFPLRIPELALLQIEVVEYDNNKKGDFGGQTCLPIPELKTGIRAVPLFNRKGEKYKNVKLLMRFQFV